MRDTWWTTLMLYKPVIIMITVGISISVFVWMQWGNQMGFVGWNSHDGFVYSEIAECTYHEITVNEDEYEFIYRFNDASLQYANYLYKALNDVSPSCESLQKQIFHTQWIYRSPALMSPEKLKKIRMALQSFFVTHYRSSVHLIMWTNNVTLLYRENLTDILEFVDVREYDPVRESKGTPLEGKMTEENLRKNDERNYFGGDLLRFIVLYKYGGLYWDIDVAFLKNVIPLMGTEFFYKWGCSKDANTAVISIKKESSLAETLLKRLIGRQDLEPNTFGWGRDMVRGLRHRDFHVLPCAWFDPLWQPSDGCHTGANTLAGFDIDWAFDPISKPLTAEDLIRNWGFTYHWHNHWDNKPPPTPPAPSTPS